MTSEWPIVGFEAIGTTDYHQLGGFLTPGVPHRRGIFPNIETNGFTGIAIVNTESNEGDIILSLRNDVGGLVTQKAFHLHAHEKLVSTLRGLLGIQNIGDGTYVEYVATTNVVTLQINSSNDSPMMDGEAGLPY